ncbi:type II toxin-antitoxin system antitoxin SocA domain-containing protein [Desulfocurvus vexinensis]|uniref:type II toxin-antitoxin system antitoxin SocA domain-containing protein n=1 Tax=Desulfocurvus vexinensis TaxID=399548 RepID=UPI00146FC176|nr:type II toxin-antitoxin system antitoxin SocA domain-containing protein [Desulfocurvus vexinensis]
MYLFDYYHAKVTGEKYSDLPWAFVYYGPYCSEAMRRIDEAVRRGDINKNTFDSKFDIDKEYSIFKCYDDDAASIGEKLNIIVVSKIQWAIRRFGDDTAELLDYVYFDTEPMHGAKKGNILDFARVTKFEAPKEIKKRPLTKDEIQKAKELISRMGKKYDEGKKLLAEEDARLSRFKADSYSKFIQFINDAESLPSFSGSAKIETQ